MCAPNAGPPCVLQASQRLLTLPIVSSRVSSTPAALQAPHCRRAAGPTRERSKPLPAPAGASSKNEQSAMVLPHHLSRCLGERAAAAAARLPPAALLCALPLALSAGPRRLAGCMQWLRSQITTPCLACGLPIQPGERMSPVVRPPRRTSAAGLRVLLLQSYLLLQTCYAYQPVRGPPLHCRRGRRAPCATCTSAAPRPACLLAPRRWPRRRR